MKLIRLTAAALLLPFMASCASLGLPTPKTPRQAVYAADGAFLAAVTIADDYKALPDCVSNGPIVCKDPATLDKIRLGANAADATLKAAENTVKDPNFGPACQLPDEAPVLVSLSELVQAAMGGEADPSNGAVFYYATSIPAPIWSEHMRVTAKIGHHIFLTDKAA